MATDKMVDAGLDRQLGPVARSAVPASKRPVVPGAEDRAEDLFFVREVFEEVAGQLVQGGDEERPHGEVVGAPQLVGARFDSVKEI